MVSRATAPVAAAMVGVAGLVAVSVALAGPRKGDVVRVERSKSSRADPLLLCQQYMQQALICHGASPRIGSEIWLIDESGVRARARVRDVEPSEIQDTCGIGSVVDVTYDVIEEIRPINSNSSSGGTLYGLQGVEVDPDNTRTPITQNRPTGTRGYVNGVVDLDGDGVPDIVRSWLDCSDQQSNAPQIAGKNVTAYCLEYWMRDGTTWTSVKRDIAYLCR